MARFHAKKMLTMQRLFVALATLLVFAIAAGDATGSPSPECQEYKAFVGDLQSHEIFLDHEVATKARILHSACHGLLGENTTLSSAAYFEDRLSGPQQDALADLIVASNGDLRWHVGGKDNRAIELSFPYVGEAPDAMDFFYALWIERGDALEALYGL